jgi:hypothetical protein
MLGSAMQHDEDATGGIARSSKDNSVQLIQWIRSLIEHPKQQYLGGIAIGILLLLAGAFIQFGTWNGLVLMVGCIFLAMSLAAYSSREVSLYVASEDLQQDADLDLKDEFDAESTDELESLGDEVLLEEAELRRQHRYGSSRIGVPDRNVILQ